MPHFGHGPALSRVPPSMEHLYFALAAGVVACPDAGSQHDEDPEHPAPLTANTPAATINKAHLITPPI